MYSRSHYKGGGLNTPVLSVKSIQLDVYGFTILKFAFWYVTLYFRILYYKSQMFRYVIGQWDYRIRN